MSIVKMKKVRVFGIDSEKDVFLNRLLSLGCVQIVESSFDENSIQAQLLKPVSDTALEEFTSKKASLESALKILNKAAPKKSGLFPEYTPVKVSDFFNSDFLKATLEKAEKIVQLNSQLEEKYSLISGARTKIAQMSPWQSMDVPLNMKGTGYTRVLFFTLPEFADLAQVEKAVCEVSDLVHIETISQDKDQRYMFAIVYKDKAEEVIEKLREFGYSEADFAGLQDTAAENITALKEKIAQYTDQCKELSDQIIAMADCREDIKICIDEAQQEISRESAKGKLMSGGKVFSLEGWVPVSSQDKLKKLFDDSCCAYEVSDHEEGEDVPVQLKDPKVIEPINMVTEMYSLPAYDNIDPNPLIFPWFTLFFGIMYADLGYGLILLTLGIIASRKIKRKGTLKYMAGLLVLCGITTSFCGIIFGSFFGDAIPVFCDLIGIESVDLWRLIDPLEEPMTALIASVAIGAVHILLGMAVNVYILVRDGHPLDALFDVGSWWLLFAGIALGVLGYGWYVAIAGCAALILTQGRSKPTIIGKLISGVASLYDITSYLGDVLSYTRLMALMLAGSVIASVVNVLGSLTGSVIVFVIVFIIGHLFNMGINIIGTFVHAARLQYLEFFGKFYKEGGKPFRPFAYKTQYTDIIKEEN